MLDRRVLSASLPTFQSLLMRHSGFFLDHGNDGNAPPNVTYTNQMAYVYNMQNSSGSFSAACQAALAPESWKCIMAPYAAPFIETSWFAFQSRFDHWQLSEETFIPCMQEQVPSQWAVHIFLLFVNHKASHVSPRRPTAHRSSRTRARLLRSLRSKATDRTSWRSSTPS